MEVITIMTDQSYYFSIYPYAVLQSQDGLFCFKICTYDYAYPDANYTYDADWHRNYLYATMPAFKAEINDIMLEGQLVSHYINNLEKFLNLQTKEVLFAPTEPFFELTFSLNERKKVDVHGYIQYPVGTGSELQFEFETDITYIEIFHRGLQAIINKFPVKK